MTQYFPVSVPYNDDEGLGFGQGSTAGVYNQYYRGGFHRPQAPEFDRLSRRKFNLNEYDGCGPYRCHYDPDPLNKLTDQLEVQSTLQSTLQSHSEGNVPHSVNLQINNNYFNTNTLFFLIICVALLYFFVFKR